MQQITNCSQQSVLECKSLEEVRLVAHSMCANLELWKKYMFLARVFSNLYRIVEEGRSLASDPLSKPIWHPHDEGRKLAKSD